MNCYVCVLEHATSTAVAICSHCGVALCMQHLREAQSYSIGGMKYDCPHGQAKAAEPVSQPRAPGHMQASVQ
jgi:hypothetical protein